MSIEVDKQPETSFTLSGWGSSIVISVLCLVISLINIPALLSAFSLAQAPVFSAALFVVMLCRAREMKIIPFFVAVLIFDIVQGFTSFYLIVIVMLWVGLKILRQKQFVWRFSYGYFAFAHLVFVLELCRFSLISIFLDRAVSWDILILSCAMQIVLYPLIYTALSEKAKWR